VQIYFHTCGHQK